MISRLNHYLRQKSCFDPSDRPLKNSPILEQYVKCENVIQCQIQKMKNIIENNDSISIVEQIIDSEIIKEGNKWFKVIDCLWWPEYGYDDKKLDINIRKFLKNYNYDCYRIHGDNVIIFPYPKDDKNTNFKINTNIFKQKKILNPFWHHNILYDGKFYIEIDNISTNTIIRMYRFKKINRNDLGDYFDW